MIYILHGDDIAVSRKKATMLFENIATTICLDGKLLQKDQITQTILAQGLFSESRGILIENFLLKNKNKKEIVTFLNENKPDMLIVFWESESVRKNVSDSLKNAKIEEFKLPKNYFAFLDGLYPKNAKKLHLLYQNLLQSYTPEQIFYSLIKRARILIILKENQGGFFKETSSLAPWQLQRLKSQASYWQKEELQHFFEKLFQTEVKMKSGGLFMSLSADLDTLLFSDLN